MTEEMEGQMSLYAQDTSFGKTSPAHCRQTTAMTLESSLKRLSGLQTKPPLFLNLKSGVMPDASWEMGIPWLGESLTDGVGDAPTLMMMECQLNTEHRNGVGESALSQILQVSGVHWKYFLSAESCEGIMRRSEKRGKQLSPILRKALEDQIAFQKSEASCGEKCGLKADIMIGADLYNQAITGDFAPTVTSATGIPNGTGPKAIVVGVDLYNQTLTGNVAKTMTNRATDSDHIPVAIVDGMRGDRIQYALRRLTPEECERLQGFPIGYTNIGEWIDSKGRKRKSTDAMRYKVLGNSICLPPWKWVLKRVCAQYERDATLGSLFDGIGGFPLIWERLNYPGACLWASEIEEFPIAVTRRRINGDKDE